MQCPAGWRSAEVRGYRKSDRFSFFGIEDRPSDKDSDRRRPVSLAAPRTTGSGPRCRCAGGRTHAREAPDDGEHGVGCHRRATDANVESLYLPVPSTPDRTLWSIGPFGPLLGAGSVPPPCHFEDRSLDRAQPRRPCSPGLWGYAHGITP